MMPKSSGALLLGMSRHLSRRGTFLDRLRDEVAVLVRIELVPREYDHLGKSLECSRILGRVVDDRRVPLAALADEGKLARTKRVPFREDLTHERGLLDVSRRAGDAPLAHRAP